MDSGSSVARIELASGLHLSNASPSVNVAPGAMYSCVIAKKRFVLRNPGAAGGEGGGGGKAGDGGGDGEANSFPGTNAIYHSHNHFQLLNNLPTPSLVTRFPLAYDTKP